MCGGECFRALQVHGGRLFETSGKFARVMYIVHFVHDLGAVKLLKEFILPKNALKSLK